MTGTIKRLVLDKSFGFIYCAGTGLEYFFHKSALEGGESIELLRPGQLVTFEVGDGLKGPRAEHVTVA